MLATDSLNPQELEFCLEVVIIKLDSIIGMLRTVSFGVSLSHLVSVEFLS